MHEAVFVAGVVPEEHAGFLLLCAVNGFGLKFSARLTIEPVRDRHVGRLVECHQAS